MEYIKGKIIDNNKDSFILESSNIGYKIWGNPQNIKDIVYIQKNINNRTLQTTLYGFATIEEKELFITLNTIRGFGPNSAYRLLLQNSPNEIIEAQNTGNIFALNTKGIKPSIVSLIVDKANKNSEAELIMIKNTLEKYGFEIHKIKAAIKSTYRPNIKIDKNILNLIKEINTLQ